VAQASTGSKAARGDQPPATALSTALTHHPISRHASRAPGLSAPARRGLCAHRPEVNTRFHGKPFPFPEISTMYGSRPRIPARRASVSPCLRASVRPRLRAAPPRACAQPGRAPPQNTRPVPGPSRPHAQTLACPRAGLPGSSSSTRTRNRNTSRASPARSTRTLSARPPAASRRLAPPPGSQNMHTSPDAQRPSDCKAG